MKRKTYSLGERLLALVLSVVLVVACMPAITLPVKAASGGDNTTVDPNTLDQWQNYFGAMAPNANNVELTTEYAGGVWTDKSVFDPDSIPSQLTDAEYEGNSFTITDEGDNFLVTLSAMASNKQIKGYSTVPTDTVFVLDLSSSMQRTDNNGQSAVDELVEATNQAITDLLALNNNNRVAVIVYAGNVNKSFSNAQGATTVILPLDSYTTDQAGTYLQIDPLTVRERVPGSRNEWQDVPNTNPYGLAVYDGVTGSTGSTGFRDNSFETATGTYMQDGVYEAMKLLLAADPVVQDGVQAGTDRMPIMVVMTDGESTMGNPDYNGNDSRTDLGTSSMYNYSGSTNGIGHRDTISFVTSLTMAFAKKTLASHYGEAPLMYTLAYGSSVLNREEARSVLDPAQASTIQNNLWNQFLAGNAVQVYSNNTTVSNSSVASEKLEASDRLYVDKYFPANSDEAMSEAFAAIVNEIILQSKYHPTYIESDPNHDGYLTFVDKIGEYMEVSSVKGIVIGDRLFSGAALAAEFNEGALGTVQNPTSLGDNLVWSVKERLGIEDTAVAQALLTSAYNNKQLYYNSDTDFDHYIGWYAKASGSNFQFLDAWYEGSAAPADATHIVKSYGFLGDTTVVPGVANTDMMYMTVRISTEIATGNSIVTWKIPAALVPTLTYEVDVEVDSQGNITQLMDLDTEMNTAESPIRLLYEVELREDIYDWNLTEKVDEDYTAYKDPGYVFYTNMWNSDPDDTTRNTYSHFEPSVENERYYFTQDTQVLSDQQGTVYTGAQPTGTGYYRSLQVFEKLTDGTLRTHTHYEAITEEALAAAVSDGNGGWVIPKGTVHRYYDYEITEKVTGTGVENTDTMDYSDHPFVEKEGDVYYTYSTQGNNGKLTMTPATGIKLTKTLAEGYANTGDFTFKIDGAVSGAQVVRLTAEGLEASRTPLAADGTLTLKAGETVYVIGLAAGNYTVSEQIPAGATYKISSVQVNNLPIAGKEAAVTLVNQTVIPVEFTNGERSTGNLIVSKDVVHPFTSTPQQITDKEFKIRVTLSGEDVENNTFNATGIPGVTSVTTVNGKFEVTLKDGQSLTVLGLPENTTYTAEEVLDPAADAGYRMDTAVSILSGTIDAAHPAQAKVVNIYEPAPVDASLTVTGTKTVTDPGGTFDWTGKSFQFKLESYDPATQAYTQIGQLAEVTVNGGSYTFSGLTFDSLGTYYYKVSEVIPTDADKLGSMSYDATTGRLVIHVTDQDVDGQMEIDVQDFTTGASLTPAGNVFTFTKDFVNVHDTQANRVEFTVNKEITGTPGTGVTAAGFLFGLYEAGATSPTYTMRTVGADGKATFHIPVVAVGETTYTLKEIHPADADKIPGMIYSTATYTVVVKAEADPSNPGELIPSVVITDSAGQPVTEPVFENEMDLDPTSVQFEVEKAMNGTPVTAETFQFTLTETDGSFATAKTGGVTDTVSITGAGTDLFQEITYHAVGTHYYVVKETAGTRNGMTYDDSEYHITVDVVVNGSALDTVVTVNKLGAGVAAEILFTNTYTVSGDTSVTISGTKTLTGRPMLNGEFTFRLTQVADENGTAMNNPYTQTAHNGPAVNGEAAVTFAPITYTAPGTYYYQVSEVEGAPNNGITYDGRSYIVIVTVEDNDQGGLKSSWSLKNGSTFQFANTYKPAPVRTDLHGTKELTGRVLKDGEFQFELYETDSTFATAGHTPIQTKRNDIHGALAFDELEYTQEGTYYYVVKEKAGASGNGVTYDASEYHVTISVVDNHKGKLETFASINKVLADGTSFAVSSMVFYNLYQAADTQVVFTVKKTMEGLRTDPSGFQFGLYRDLNEAPIQTVTSDADGVVSFQPVTYTMDHLQAGSFTYYIKEIVPAGAANGITYDSTVYTVTVNLEDDTNGNLVATYTVDGADVDEATYQFSFVNRYQVTGTAKTDIVGKKTLQGKTLTAGMFTFELYAGSVATGTPIATAKNAADGTILFADVELTALGVNTFTVKEAAPDGGKEKGITYSNLVYTVTVETEDDGLGGMRAKSPVYSLGAVAQTQMEFINTYAAEGTVTAAVEGKKILQGGKKLTANLFTFELYEAGTAQPKAVVQNSADGTFKFDLSFDKAGIYTYTVKELAPAGNKADGVTYSELVYTVQITVEDNGEGGLVAKAPVYQLDNKTVASVEFVNVYTPENLPVSLKIQKIMKTLSGQEQSPEGYSFKIADESGKELAVVKSDAKGDTGYDLTFTPADVGKTYTYVVSEVNTKVTGVTYSTAQYTVKIAISQNDSGVLVPAITLDGKAVDAVALTFVNTYEVAETPETGDSFNLVLCVGLMVASTVGMVTVVLLKKKEETA